MRLLVAVVLLAACGDGLDAPDAAVTTDGGPAGLVRVQYLDDVVGESHLVFFQNADSSLVLAGHTDGAGRANAYMASGGFVTVVAPQGSTTWIYTIAGVEAGDDLLIDRRFNPPEGTGTPLGIKIPDLGDASFYQLNSSCGFADIRGAERAQIQVLLDNCSDHADLLVLAIGSAYRYLYREDVPVGVGKSVTFDEPYRNLERAQVHVTNVPPSVPELIVTQSLIGEGHELWGPSTTGSAFGQGTVPISGGTGDLDHDMLLPATGTLLTQLDPSSATTIGTQHVVQWGPTLAATSVDYGATSLRPYTDTAHYVLGQHVLRWTEAPAGTVPDGVIASFSWLQHQLGGTSQWVVVAPRTAEAVLHLPVLPAAGLTPEAEDSIVDPFILTNIAIDGGYRRIRAARLIGHFGFPGQPWPPDGTAGRVVFEDLTPQVFGPD